MALLLIQKCVAVHKERNNDALIADKNKIIIKLSGIQSVVDMNKKLIIFFKHKF